VPAAARLVKAAERGRLASKVVALESAHVAAA